MTLTLIAFFVLLGIVAFLYSSVGHGGASGYLALMALFSFMPEVMRSTALILNVLVAGLAFFHYYRQGHFQWRLFWPFAITSIPASFLGGLLVTDPDVYKKLLGVLLIVATARMLWKPRDETTALQPLSLLPAALIGVGIGFISGLIGIGGGIILSPVILLLHWGNMRTTAAVSALFILVNSLAGLLGMSQHGITWDERMPWMILIAFVGGLAGSYLGAARLHLSWLRYSLAIVLLIASLKLIFA